jgi:hypothetical protein
MDKPRHREVSMDPGVRRDDGFTLSGLGYTRHRQGGR